MKLSLSIILIVAFFAVSPITPPVAEGALAIKAGADLLTDASASFPSRTPVQNGTSIDFGTGAAALE